MTTSDPESRGIPASEPVLDHQPRHGAFASHPRPDPRAPAFVPLALWTAASFGLLVLATLGPKLWAGQNTENAAIALEIVAVGQAILAAVVWPLWTRSIATTLGVILSSPAWLFLAGRIAAAPIAAVYPVLWKLAAVELTLAIARLATPRTAIGFLWATLLTAAIGGPVLWFLARGG